MSKSEVLVEKEGEEIAEEESIKTAISEVVVKDYNPLVLVSFRMPTPMFETLEKYCKDHGLKRSEALNEALSRLLEKGKNVDKRSIKQLIADSTKESWGTEIFDIRLAGKLALERNIVGEDKWSDEYLTIVLREYSGYIEGEELEESDVEGDLRFFASAIKVELKRVLGLYEKLGEEHSGEDEEKW